MNADHIEISNDHLRARLSPRGAGLVGLWHGAVTRSLVLGYADGTPAGYMGALVGPVANRIGGAAVTIDGTRWQMQANEGTTCLHSGDDGVHSRVWTVSDHSATEVTFSLALDHGECGLPGIRRMNARYTLEGSALRLDICAITDRTTVMNIAHHPYWNLAGSGTVQDHSLRVFGDSYLPVDADKLPTGAQTSISALGLMPDRDTPLHHAAPMDHNICLGRKRDTPHPAACLTGPNGLHLTISTTEPGLQVYDGAGLPDQPDAAMLGAKIGPYAGIALEPQGWPNAPHNDSFPAITLLSGNNYRQTTIYTLN
ncbi:aldose epimerase family protein [uncultured Pseudosulfitobacter sp.]|uniref:aldose epimerase family protein n=1 Tax=uncultured Pseudosulfitobacter sp. TaxID=2854214 RepID=UPI0030D73F93|tara:strand:- start:391 stop:1326 length:936 start_codon:yes stop_codon:yes gene_type:complete